MGLAATDEQGKWATQYYCPTTKRARPGQGGALKYAPVAPKGPLGPPRHPRHRRGRLGGLVKFWEPRACNERVLVLFEWKAHEGVRVRLRCGLVLVRECLRSGDRWGTGLPLQALQEGTGTGSPVQPGRSRRLPGRLSSSRRVDWAALPLPGRGRSLPRGTYRSDSKSEALAQKSREMRRSCSAAGFGVSPRTTSCSQRPAQHLFACFGWCASPWFTRFSQSPRAVSDTTRCWSSLR